jgi:hypothetical protein
MSLPDRLTFILGLVALVGIFLLNEAAGVGLAGLAILFSIRDLKSR